MEDENIEDEIDLEAEGYQNRWARLKNKPKRKQSADTFERNVKYLERITRQELNQDNAEWLLRGFNEILDINVKNNIPKTRDKKKVIWAVFIATIRFSINFIEKSNFNDKIEQIKRLYKILEILKEKNPKRFKDAEEFNFGSIKKQFSQKNPNSVSFKIDLKEVDSSLGKLTSPEFGNLFLGDCIGVPEDIKDKRVERVIEPAKTIAHIYLKNEIIKQIKNTKKNIHYIQNRDGLVGVCCYFVCENDKTRKFKIKNQAEWAKFLGISESSFKKLYRALNETEVIPTRPLSEKV